MDSPGFDRQAGRDGAVEGNADERAARVMRGVEEAAGLAVEPVERAFFDQGVDMALDGERAGEAEVRLDLAERRRHALLALVCLEVAAP